MHRGSTPPPGAAASPSELDQTRIWSGRRPVSIAALPGTHTGDGVYARTKLVARAARPRKWGSSTAA